MSEKEVDKTKSDLSLFGEADPLVGKIVEGKWQIIDFLGEGSISTVYLAKARDTGKHCILKHIHKHLTEGIRNLKKFRQRLNNLADSLKGKNVLQYQEIHVADDKQVWLVLDNVDFESLEDLLSKRGHIAIERAASLFKQVCNGLSEGEAAGFQHRDLKPSNIIIINDEKFTDDVRLTDFGIAQILTEETESNSSSQYITHTGKVFGSPLYLSPEQCTGKRLDQRSDIYSLGCVMYETLIGKPPFVGKNVLETAYKHMNEAPREIELEDADPRLVSRFQTVIFKCLNKAPDERYQSIGQLKSDLELLLLANDEEWSTTANAFQVTAPISRRRFGLYPLSSEFILFGALTLILTAVPIFWVTTSFGHRDKKYPPLNEKMLWVVQNKAVDSEVEGFEPRKQAALDALDFVRDEQGEKSEEYANALSSLVELFANSAHWKEAEEKTRELLEVTKSVKGQWPQAESYRILGYVCFMQGKLDESEKYCLKAVSMSDAETLPTGSKLQPLRVLGDIYSQRDDLESALKIYEKLYGITEGIKENHPPIYQDACSKLADIYSRMGNYPEAEKYYRLGLDWWRSHNKDESIYAAKSLYGLGSVLALQRKNDQAEEAFKEGLPICRATAGARSSLMGAMQKKYLEVLWHNKPWEALRMQLSEGAK